MNKAFVHLLPCAWDVPLYRLTSSSTVAHTTLYSVACRQEECPTCCRPENDDVRCLFLSGTNPHLPNHQL